ncbi:Phospholipid-transporting ATPase DNF1 [Penicillium macrosclerotiorum]|uniref:Phospholipid-transporting ATPase DNF1 n=1 Tax=Penicillium macrosclerotiorum TaxID=303699 RepID=UPI002546F9DC|nr:Phospholipid-transporting ATPase DNF1 [Penicillium macrosclerotiorum]KAJ5699119.1 Phospholipid-transporting ATPase DNF1 [Penicillium macrosclerotiorum]
MASVHFPGDNEGGGNENSEIREVSSNISKPTKRQRWATTRHTGSGGVRKRVSIIDRFHKRSEMRDEKRKSATPSTSADAASTVGEESQQPGQNRTIYFNIPIPESERDEEGHLKNTYPRNKIRTAKYTALTFVPKNIWLQFHNIANIYFLFVIILNFFSIFGANNPGLNAVPLIVIIVVTAIKDAIEDWGRTVLDNQVNNSPVYRLIEWNNVNSTEDNISLWRRFKKACTRGTITSYHWMKSVFGKKNEDEDDGNEQRRDSFLTTATPRASVYSHRDSLAADVAIPMTDVPSPQTEAREDWTASSKPENKFLSPESANRDSVMMSPASPDKKSGSVVDMSKQTPGKARFKRDYWKNIQVGDFVRLYNEDPIPADIVILSTSDPDGACYVETKGLDGETNLKVRQALHCGRQVRHARDCEKAEFTIESEAPHPNLYAYNGAIRWDQRDPQFPEAPRKEMVEPVTINNMLLRGCSLRSTEWVLGVVVFTGGESKIMLNAGATPAKRARLAKDLNWNVIYNFIILFIMCLVAGIVNGFAWAAPDKSLDFFDYGSYGGTPAVTGIVTFWTALILFQNLVPISLYISLEIVRTIQAVFIHSDLYMYYERLGLYCVPKSWNISDDVGQVEYIFSDKTGTLTQNVMEFKKSTINGLAYGEAYTEAQIGMRRREGVNADEEAAQARAQIAADGKSMLEGLRRIHDNPYLKDENLTFIAPNFVTDLEGQSGEAQKKAVEHFMLALALCHSVITEHTPGDPPQIEFKAQSPDEAALVSTARDCGFTVLGRAGDDLLLNIMGEERTYTVLNTLEFNSSRKRMSSIIRMPDGTIRLFCKGADSIIYSRLARGKQQDLRRKTAEHLEEFAKEGLRTLCVADRLLGEEEYQAWNREHDIAAAAITDREEKLEKVSSEIEQELMLLGGTAIEDRLQDGVPDTIQLLADAGIKLWVLTGDKVETAINIGFSCNLLNNNMDLIVLNVPEGNHDDAARELDKHLQVFGLTGSDEELVAARADHTPPEPTHAVIVDGETLKMMLSDELKQRFLLLCKQCKAVLCCRVSPSQKAAVVNMVRHGLNIMGLAIGDGANDVAMIQEADVGVGIAGEEGRQAVMSSDYAIGQFRFLQRLLLVHGRWSYRRLGECTANFFYKNLVWTFALFWYCIYNDFDGSYLFDYTYIVLVNLAFTSLPVIFMGIFDQDVDDRVSLAVPQLYMRGIERKEWSQLKFWLYMGDGLYQSVICFFMPYMLYKVANFATESGRDIADRNRMGILVATCAVLASNIYIMMNTYRWDWFTCLINAISCLLIFFWTGVYSSFTAAGQFYSSAAEVYGALSFWIVLLVTLMISLLPRFTYNAIQKVFFPLDVDIVREQVTLGKFKHLEDQEDPLPPKEATAVGAASSDESAVSSDLSKPIQPSMKHDSEISQEPRPYYSPSAHTNGHNPRSQNGSNGTNYTESLDQYPRPQSVDYVRRSHERTRHSFERVRQSFEQSRDFSSAAMLQRVESSQTHGSNQDPFRAPGEPPAHMI